MLHKRYREPFSFQHDYRKRDANAFKVRFICTRTTSQVVQHKLSNLKLPARMHDVKRLRLLAPAYAFLRERCKEITPACA